MSLEILTHIDGVILTSMGSLVLAFGLSAFRLARAFVRGERK